jgi:hypothetical protein
LVNLLETSYSESLIYTVKRFSLDNGRLGFQGNAPDELKAVADYVTLDVEHSGLAAALNRLLF